MQHLFDWLGISLCLGGAIGYLLWRTRRKSGCNQGCGRCSANTSCHAPTTIHNITVHKRKQPS